MAAKEQTEYYYYTVQFMDAHFKSYIEGMHTAVLLQSPTLLLSLKQVMKYSQQKQYWQNRSFSCHIL